MFNRNTSAVHRFLISSIIAFFLTTSICGLCGLMMPAATRKSQQPGGMSAVRLAGDNGEHSKKQLTPEQQSVEARIWHEANRQLLTRSEAAGPQALAAEIIHQDTNDIAVIQGDSRIIIPPKFFDLNLRAVTFSPTGGGYSISTASSLFDNNLGTKRDMTASPAVNPFPNAEPGDDAYIVENLGFDFNFFGGSYSSVAVSSNGNIVLRPAGVSQADFDSGAVSSIAKLAEFQSGLPRIAAYWHDLDARGISLTSASSGVFVRKLSDSLMVTWNNIRDFPSDPQVDNGIHRFQITLYKTGRIVFTYDAATLTTQALVGITPGQSRTTPRLIDLSAPPSDGIDSPVGEFFSVTTRLDYIAAAQAFYTSHPNQDVYDFLYVFTDFSYDLGGSFAFYDPIRNDATGIGLSQSDPDTTELLGSRKIQGILNLNNIAGAYPLFPTTRFQGANHGLSILGHEQGHRWLSFVKFPGNDLALLGRENAHWNFFLNIESTISHPAARRSSSLEGNVWNDNGNGTFTSVNLVDGYSQLDQYLMGLRPASAVSETFVITNPAGTEFARDSSPRPGVTTSGFKQPVSIDQIVQANNVRTPSAETSQKHFRAAVVLVTRQGTQPAITTLNKITLYRLAFESYFAQSTDLLASINTGLSDQGQSRFIGTGSAANYQPPLAPGEIATIFGTIPVNTIMGATSMPLPTTLANTQVRVNGLPAPLFFVSPTQINFQIPRTTTATTPSLQASSATALIEVVSGGQLIRAGAVQIAPAVPAIFTHNQGGVGPAEAIDAIRGGGEPFNPKQPNGLPTIIAFFATGLGADATDVGGDVSSSVQVTIDGSPVLVGYAGRAPGFTGLNQINIYFPEKIASGTHALVISRNGIPSRQVTISVR